MTLPSDIKVPFIRLFIGIPLPDHILRQIHSFQKKYQKLYGIRWIPPKNQHITLLFIGKTEKHRLPKIKNKFQKIMTNIEPFQLELEKLCYAPGAKNPRMIWAQFIANNQFRALSATMKQAFPGCLPPDVSYNDPTPHITIARIKKFRRFNKIDFDYPIRDNIIDVKECILWESILNPEGAIYKVKSVVKLG